MNTTTLDPTKFKNPITTANGDERAWVRLNHLQTLWINTGTLCNLTCANCYIESSPTNDRYAYITVAEVLTYLDEIERDQLGTEEIGVTGGEPFMNPDIVPILTAALERGLRVLVLTNAMKPMLKCADELVELQRQFGDQLAIRVSADHYLAERHEEERGPKSWEPMLTGMKWLSDNGFNLSVASRTYWGETEEDMRSGFRSLFSEHGIEIDAADRARLVLFPEMDEKVDVPEITTGCWEILNLSPDSVMCASSRMVVKRRENDAPTVVACTLLPYDKQFELGQTLKDASKPVHLNHPHCAKFCVLGGASCSA